MTRLSVTLQNVLYRLILITNIYPVAMVEAPISCNLLKSDKIVSVRLARTLSDLSKSQFRFPHNTGGVRVVNPFNRHALVFILWMFEVGAESTAVVSRWPVPGTDRQPKT